MELNKCELCNKTFFDRSTKRRHLKTIHKQDIQDKRENHIICPLCRNTTSLQTYLNLSRHLRNEHAIVVEEKTLEFATQEEYSSWNVKENLEVNYVRSRTFKKEDGREIHYFCNRSNTIGYKTTSKSIRSEKSGGTIKINGVCPARLIVKSFNDGHTIVQLWKTHVGHEEEIRTQHLSNPEQILLVEKLKLGVPTDRIIEDARKVKNEEGKITRLNTVTKKDLNNLSRKYNIEKKRHTCDALAVALKIKEWNAQGKQYAFFYKQEGETHPILKTEDYAIGFMNGTMENKLREYGNKIICMDGTHGTNRKGLDLTVVLVKDDRNAGFPVAFFLSNRLDQICQEVFLGALRETRNICVQPKYFMSDDDPKYYNAWVKVMENEPRRLLCTWHVVKNWNIQGRNKIKNPDLKKIMKSELKKILNETKVNRFEELSEKYLKKLELAGETDFLNYLKKYYFQSKERIKMWAHCHRLNAGINTNMALESLNNLLKTNILKRRANVTVEHLLDKLEDLVDARMWQRILNFERPNANNHMDKLTIKAHKTAEATDKNLITEVSFGLFQVKSFSGNNLYQVSYNELCQQECKAGFCRICKICLHRYTCECQQYAVRSIICKHIHLVCLFEKTRENNSVLEEVLDHLPKENESEIKKYHQEEIQQFVQEQRNVRDSSDQDDESFKKLAIQKVTNFLNNLDDMEEFKKVVGKMFAIEKEYEKVSKKRKLEKQEYFPAMKKSRQLYKK